MRWRNSETEDRTHTSPAEIDEADSNSAATTNPAATSAAASVDQQESSGASRSSSPLETAPDPSLEADDGGMDHAEPDIPWRPQTTTSVCEFTHVITDYASKRESGCKKAEYSATTIDDKGNRWRLIIYVNGNGRASNHHLSLFLQVADAEDLPFGWKKAVSYVLTLEHPSGKEDDHFGKRNPDKTFKLCPKAIDWGWSQFITSDRIQQEGFIQNDSLVVRASVTVKSSSVSIDKDDAELYLKSAVEDGDAESVQLCLDHGANVNCQFKDDLYSPLHTACSSGSSAGTLDVLNLLLSRGADGNACNKWKETPLLIAANNGNRAAVEALLENGADPSLCSEAGWSALTFASHKGYEEIVELLIEADAPVNSLVTEDASTPLHKACAGSKPGHVKAVKFLLKGGADVHVLNKWRETPLLTAANHGQAGAVDALLRHGADPCRCTDTGWSPLSIAAYKGHDEVVRLLLEEEAPTEEDDPTLSALLQAATKGLTSTVDLLLRYDADHTVTTKKGDTALSILVEQNLIDAAANMVIQYGASIPRCSRDRRKVQRARLLIQLQLKKREEEASSTDEEGTDDNGERVTEVLSRSKSSPNGKGSPAKAKKKGKPKQSAEQKAKEAEEALLLELEKEESKAKKVEAEANSKRARNKKKKEREKQRKLKEEQERRERLDREAEERERLLQEKVEQERKRQQQERREREEKEMIEREKIMEAKLKERKKREKEQRWQEEVAKNQAAQATTQESTGVASKAPLEKATASDEATPSPAATKSKGRRWETNNSSLENQSGLTTATAGFPNRPPLAKSDSGQPASPWAQSGNRKGGTSVETTHPETGSIDSGHSVSTIPFSQDGELPGVAFFRLSKLAELVGRCANGNGALEESTIKRALYRWIIRASHLQLPSLDPIIPSWAEESQLIGFFQRQFITDCRHGQLGSFNMEALKNAGSFVAGVCQAIAKEVVEFRQEALESTPLGWDDSTVQMQVVESLQNGTSKVICLSWANKANVNIPATVFADLQRRYSGASSRFLSSAFSAKMWYDAKQLLVTHSEMDACLSDITKRSLTKNMRASAELASDPFSVASENVFWGTFEYPDKLFGGQKPFAKDDQGDENILARFESSVFALLPFDSMVASNYIRRILDIVESANESSSPVSFTCFLHSESFSDGAKGPSASNLKVFDARLGAELHPAVKRIETLAASEHTFQAGGSAPIQKICSTQSLLLVLQSEAAISRFPASDHAIAEIIRSMSIATPADIPPSPRSFRENFNTSPGSNIDPFFIDPIGAHAMPRTPDQDRSVHTGFGSIGGTGLLGNPSPSIHGREKKSRLFDLVDDGEEDQADLVTGMLDNLDVGLFQSGGSSGNEVDIEAISLMGIGAPPKHTLPPGNSSSGPFG